MSDQDGFEKDSPELEPVAEWLREQRPEASPLRLDEIKRSARARTAGSTAPRRRVSTIAVGLALAVGFGGAFAIAGPPSFNDPPGSAADSQYRPGKGCGDKNHVHEREDECKKPPK